MENHTWQPPQLHQAWKEQNDEERSVSWLELFYDLVYVATLIQLGNLLSDNVTLRGFLSFLLLFIPIWWSWTGLTFYMNRFVIDDVWHRLLIFGQIFAISIMGISVELAIGERAAVFALTYAVIRLIVIALYWRAAQHIPAVRPLSQRYTRGFGLASLIWIASIFFPAPIIYIMWVVGMLVDFYTAIAPETRRHQALIPPDIPHMAERYGIFTIIVLGESFVKVIGSASGETVGPETLLYGLAALTIACSLWWYYFDNIPEASIRNPKEVPSAPYIWIYAHLPIAIGITAFGVGIKKLVWLHGPYGLADNYRWLICFAAALAVFFIASIMLVTHQHGESLQQRQRRAYQLFAVVAVLLLFAAWGGQINTNLLAVLLALTVATPLAVTLISGRPANKSLGVSISE